MKACTRFHFEDVEVGDKIVLAGDCNDEDAPPVTVVVASRYTTHNFGPVIRGRDGETYYLYDYDSVGHVREDQ